jgi:tRNA pseudouridine65 synthase
MAAPVLWTSLPLGPGVRVLQTHPAGLAALDKPAGCLSHPNTPDEAGRALLTGGYDAGGEHYHWTAAEDGEPRRLWLLNRLDSATSGVILVAADEALAGEIRRLFREKHVHKVYQALVFGAPPLRRELWQDRLATARAGGKVRSTAGGHVPASALMTLVRQSRDPAAGLSLLQLEPRTGRSHQLRVQCRQRRLPIVGDATYGDFRLNREFARATGHRRMFLHSLRTDFTFPWRGGRAHFTATAPLPKEFVAALDHNPRR